MCIGRSKGAVYLRLTRVDSSTDDIAPELPFPFGSLYGRNVQGSVVPPRLAKWSKSTFLRPLPVVQNQELCTRKRGLKAHRYCDTYGHPRGDAQNDNRCPTCGREINDNPPFQSISIDKDRWYGVTEKAIAVVGRAVNDVRAAFA